MDLDPLSPLEAERMVRSWMDRLGEVQGELKERLEAAGEADADYKIAWAQAFLGAEGPVEVRKAKATVAADKELRAKGQTHSLAVSAKEAADNARSRLSAAQSILSHASKAMSYASGVGG